VPNTLLVDPLGRQITLHNHTWYGHVLQRHRELRPYRTLVHQAVTGPLEIRISDSEPGRLHVAGEGSIEGSRARRLLPD